MQGATCACLDVYSAKGIHRGRGGTLMQLFRVRAYIFMFCEEPADAKSRSSLRPIDRCCVFHSAFSLQRAASLFPEQAV